MKLIFEEIFKKPEHFSLTFIEGGKKNIITYRSYIIWYDKRKQKIRLHLLNHDYSNMNIPYINENLFAFITVQNNIYIPTECVRSTVSIDAPPPNFVAIVLVNAN